MHGMRQREMLLAASVSLSRVCVTYDVIPALLSSMTIGTEVRRAPAVPGRDILTKQAQVTQTGQDQHTEAIDQAHTVACARWLLV